MNVLKRCCYRSLRENPKRTIVTIVGIILATSLITAVACMVVSFQASMMEYEKQENGDYHYRFSGVESSSLKYFENNANIEKYGLVEKIGYALLEGSQNPDKPYLFVAAMDERAETALALHLTEGRMPENGSEVVIGSHIRSNGLVDMEIGDTLNLEIGDRVSDGWPLGQGNAYQGEEERLETAFEKTYTVVGIIERPNLNVEPRTGPGYSIFTRLENPGEGRVLDVYATYTKQGVRNAEKVTEGILGVTEDLYRRYYGGMYGKYGLGKVTEEEVRQIQSVAENVTEHYWLLRWERLDFSSSTMNMLYAMSAVAILIIIVTSVFCIRNSFTISLTEKMKFYGRLSSVGTTSGQQRKMVYYEASFLGIVGIPLGVACGVGAAAVLVIALGSFVEEAFGFALVFDISVWAVLLAVVLAEVTIFFSASGSARKAAKISPLSAIRANDTVKMSRRELRCPRAVEKFFGIGGKIAYKNLRRARVKYRTTVVSIVVSVAVFIGMTTFVSLMSRATDIYYETTSFQMRVGIWNQDYESAVQIAGLEGVQEAEIVRRAGFVLDREGIPYTELGQKFIDRMGTVSVQALGEEAYARYCERVGVSVEEAEDKAIVLAYYSNSYRENGKIYTVDGELAEFKPGDIIRGTYGEDETVEIEVLTQTRTKPLSGQDERRGNICLIVSDAWLESQMSEAIYDDVNIYIRCEDADRLEERIRDDYATLSKTVTNYDAVFRAERSQQFVVSVFLYGFITVVALIGITNIFNTVTTNMELRAPEFAMLKSVGMTGREFRRMVWLEGMFYGGKALAIGIPAGVLLSLCFHAAMNEGIVTAFRFPWAGTILSAAAVVVLLVVIMHYSMGKINRRNIIETIQSENL